MADIKEELEKGIMQYLDTKGVEVKLAELPIGRPLGGSTTGTGLQLSGQPVDSIVCARGSTTWTTWCYFRVALDWPLTKESKKAVKASTSVIRERSLLSILWAILTFRDFLFGRGKVLEVRWRGGGIAESLNRDANLSRMLLDYAADGWGVDDVGAGSIDIWPSGSWVDIKSPTFFGAPSVDKLPSALPFELYCGIAEHVRREALI